MSATLARPPISGANDERLFSHLELERSHTGYGIDLFGDAELFTPTSAQPSIVYRLAVQVVPPAPAPDATPFADEQVLLPPTRRQRMQIRIRERRVGTLLPDCAE